jgi:alkaline phosphatase
MVLVPSLLLALVGCDPVAASADSGSVDSAQPVDSGETGALDSGGDSGAETGETGEPPDTGDSGVVEDTASGGETGDTGDTGAAPGPGILLYIGDGMGFVHVEGGGRYATGTAGTLVMEGLPVQGRLRTASLSGVTDSAAAGTALSTGTKTYNERLGVDRDLASVENVLERARAAGLAVGVVSTDRLTGATPSAFTVHVEDRSDYAGIAEAWTANLPDLSLGGGLSDFSPLFATMTAQVVSTRTDLLAAVNDGRPLFGAFAGTTFPFVADGYTPETPTLAEMTAFAIDYLDDEPSGFLLVVEGARIDHASHSSDEMSVFDEVLSFDDAVAEGVAWASATGRDVTMVVTADHECGGLGVSGVSAAGEVPASTWRWGEHTNADVPVFASGALTTVFDGQRLDQVWVHAVLAASIDQAASVTSPTVPTLVDGYTGDLGAQVSVQPWSTSFGAGYNQLDALYVTGDADGLWVGIDGVFERGDNAVLVLVDLDYGAATGLGADLEVGDTLDALDSTLTTASLSLAVGGLGFDAAFGALGAEEIGIEKLSDQAGLRGFDGDIGTPTDFHWLEAISNFDDGNIAEGAAALDAGATGLTEGGLETLLPWTSLFPAGIPAAGTTVAVSVVLVNYGGDWASNQALPAFATSTEAGESAFEIVQVATLSVDATGVATGTAALSP